jgi:hypothetical protein
MLFLNVGIHEDKSVGFDASLLPKPIIDELRGSLPLLEQMPVKEQMNWIAKRGVTPAMRTLFTNKINVLHEYPIEPLKPASPTP